MEKLKPPPQILPEAQPSDAVSKAEQEADEPRASTSSPISQDEEKSVQQIDMQSILQNPTIEALSAIIKEIQHQFDEIAAGNYPKPQPKEMVERDDEPMLGGVLLTQPEEQPVETGDSKQPPEPLLGATKSEMEEQLNNLRSQINTFQRLAEIRDNIFANVDKSPLVQLKMDRVQLPTFSGDLTQWIAFRDQYLELVYDNNTLSPITKFYQLKGHLRGMALEAMNGFKMSAADYDTAWSMLRKRYDKPDQIIEDVHPHI